MVLLVDNGSIGKEPFQTSPVGRVGRVYRNDSQPEIIANQVLFFGHVPIVILNKPGADVGVGGSSSLDVGKSVKCGINLCLIPSQ